MLKQSPGERARSRFKQSKQLPPDRYVDAELPAASPKLAPGSLLKRIDILNHEAPIGYYLIDDWLAEVKGKGVQIADGDLRSLRASVDIAGAHALNIAHAELVICPRGDRDVRRLQADLLTILKLIERVRRLDPEAMSLIVANRSDAVDAGYDDELKIARVAPVLAHNALETLQAELFRVQQQIEAYCHRYPAPARTGDKSDALRKAFIMLMGWAWLAHFKRMPAKADQSLFVRLLEASWVDLQFPTPLGQDLRAWFRDAIRKQKREIA